MDYRAIYIPSKTGYGAYSPDVPGCVAAGDTLEEVRSRISEALHVHINSMVEDGDALPTPSETLGELEPFDILEVIHVQIDGSRLQEVQNAKAQIS